MTSQNIDWNILKIFGKVVETGNFSHAANALGVSQPTVSRAIETLEQILGYQLFARTTKGLIISDAAKELAEFSRAMSINCDTFTRVAGFIGDEIQGTIRISASEIVGVQILPHILKNIADKFPNIEFEIIASDEISNLMEREADIAIRMTPPAQNTLLAQKIGELEIGAFASEQYLKTHQTPQTIDDLSTHTTIFYDKISPFLHPFLKHFPMIRDTNFKYRADSPLVQLGLVFNGAGIGFCQAGIAIDYGLKRVLPDQINVKLPVWIAMHENLKNRKRYITIFRELGNELREYINHITPN